MRTCPGNPRDPAAAMVHHMSDLPSVQEVRLVLSHMLSRARFAGAIEFLAQVEAVEAVSGRIDYVDLSLSPSAVAAPYLSNPLPVYGYVNDARGEPLGQFLLWAADGKLDCVEYAEYLHEYKAWPSLDQLVDVRPS